MKGTSSPRREFHAEKAAQVRSHFKMRQGSGHDLDPFLADGLEDGLHLFLGIDEGIGSPELPKEVGV
jgi:hypothetical protein